MIQIKQKLQMKLNNSVPHLITDYRLLITAMLLPATLLSGCMGIYEGGFECPAGTGVGCKSISDVNTMVNQCSVPSIQCSECAIPELKATPPSPSECLEIWYSPHFRGQSESMNEVSPILMGV